MQFVHVAAPVKEKVLAEQFVQDALPSVFLYLPAAQAMQDVSPAGIE